MLVGVGVEGVVAFLIHKIGGNSCYFKRQRNVSSLLRHDHHCRSRGAPILNRDMIPTIVFEFLITYLCYTYIFFYAKNITF